MASSYLSRCLPTFSTKHVERHAASPREPGNLKSIAYILYRLHTAKPLGVEHELPQTLLEDLKARLKFALHVSQRTARILGTLLLRACVKHPLGEAKATACRHNRHVCSLASLHQSGIGEMSCSMFSDGYICLYVCCPFCNDLARLVHPTGVMGSVVGHKTPTLSCCDSCCIRTLLPSITQFD